MKLSEIKKGARVYWNDPDEGLCSCAGFIADFKRPLATDSIITVTSFADGSEIEALPRELDLMPCPWSNL